MKLILSVIILFCFNLASAEEMPHEESLDVFYKEQISAIEKNASEKPCGSFSSKKKIETTLFDGLSALGFKDNGTVSCKSSNFTSIFAEKTYNKVIEQSFSFSNMKFAGGVYSSYLGIGSKLALDLGSLNNKQLAERMRYYDIALNEASKCKSSDWLDGKSQLSKNFLNTTGICENSSLIYNETPYKTLQLCYLASNSKNDMKGCLTDFFYLIGEGKFISAKVSQQGTTSYGRLAISRFQPRVSVENNKVKVQSSLCEKGFRPISKKDLDYLNKFLLKNKAYGDVPVSTSLGLAYGMVYVTENNYVFGEDLKPKKNSKFDEKKNYYTFCMKK